MLQNTILEKLNSIFSVIILVIFVTTTEMKPGIVGVFLSSKAGRSSKVERREERWREVEGGGRRWKRGGGR